MNTPLTDVSRLVIPRLQDTLVTWRMMLRDVFTRRICWSTMPQQMKFLLQSLGRLRPLHRAPILQAQLPHQQQQLTQQLQL
jgi:hypothetical protein